jgi:hypothetical protein
MRCHIDVMQMTPFVDALMRDLASVAGGAPAEEREIVRRLGAALEASARLRLLEAVSEAAQELSSQLPEGRAEVRLAGAEPSLVYVPEERVAAAAGSGEDALAARISLRLSQALKVEVESAAARDGTSANSWIVQTLTHAVEARPRVPGRRLTGYARS